MTEDITLDPADLDTQLREDKTGAVRNAAVARITEIAQDLKRQMDAGVAPGDFQKLNAVHDAMTEMPKVIETAWNTMRALEARITEAQLNK